MSKLFQKTLVACLVLCLVCALATGCGSQPAEPAEHTHTLVHQETKEPTCVNNGILEHWYCPDCNARFSDEEGTTEVAFADLEVEELGHTGGTATCTEKAVCERCETPYGNLAEHVGGVDATCTAPQTCTACGTELVAAKGHTAGADATCTAPQTCTVCGTELAAAKGHDFGDNPTCGICGAENPDYVPPVTEPKEEVMIIGWPKSFSTKNTVYLWIDKAHNVEIYNDMTGICNEETHILVNDQAWGGTLELRAFENYQWLYIDKINAEKGTKVTFKAGFTVTANGTNYVLAEDYNIWWDGAKWVEYEVTPEPKEEVMTVGWPKNFSDKNTVYLWIDKEHDVALWGNMAGVANEETHILINDQAWSTQEIIAFENYKWFYIGKIGGDVGTKITIKAGFTITAKGVNYVLAEDYNIWWNGTAWVETEVVVPSEPEPTEPETEPTEPETEPTEPETEPTEPETEPTEPEVQEEVMIIGWPKSFSTKNTVYLWIDKAHNVEIYNDMTGICNEETHILVNDQAWGGALELRAFEGYKWLYIDKINAEKGTKVTFKAGFTVTAGGVNYVLAEDYNIWWNGSAWVETEVVADPPAEVMTVGWPKNFSDKNTVYLWIDKEHDVALWGNMAGVANEETHILINDQAWSTQEIIAFENYKWFYIGKIGGDVGTKITIKAGFTITANGVNYVLAEDYNIWWNGTAWVETEVTS